MASQQIEIMIRLKRVGPQARVPRFVPTVLEPTACEWAQLEAADRFLLAHVLHDPADFMDAPAFHHAGAEEALFGAETSLSGTTTRFAAMPPGRRNSGGTRSAADERLLFQQLNYARMRRCQLLHQFGLKRMPMQNIRLLLAWVYRETELRNQIVELNMPLVISMVRKFRRADVDRNDLVSEGSLALLRCVDKFDCGLGFKFSTYACRAILKGCSRRCLRVSRYASRFPVGYDSTMNAECKRIDTKFMYLEEVREILAENRAELTARERAVISARFQLGDDSPGSRHPTLSQVGEQIGITKARVLQIQRSALGKLRGVLEGSFLPNRWATS